MKPKKIKPKQGQESVWDYPRPPRMESFHKNIKIYFAGELIADTIKSYRVLETSHPPVYYLPQSDLRMDFLKKSQGNSFCEWKGNAEYYDLVFGKTKVEKAGWFYANPKITYWKLKDHVAFYANKMQKCLIDGETVIPQPGGFYGGWITKNIVGPFKGEPGTWGW